MTTKTKQIRTMSRVLLRCDILSCGYEEQIFLADHEAVPCLNTRYYDDNIRYRRFVCKACHRYTAVIVKVFNIQGTITRLKKRGYNVDYAHEFTKNYVKSTKQINRREPNEVIVN